jgi:hypothetical protein
MAHDTGPSDDHGCEPEISLQDLSDEARNAILNLARALGRQLARQHHAAEEEAKLSQTDTGSRPG